MALAAGVVLGGGGVGVAWAVSGSDAESASDAAADAQDACGVLDRLDESKYTTKGATGEVMWNRWGAAEVLATSAAAGDSAYEPLATALQNARRRLARTFTIDAKVREDMVEARSVCEDL